MRAVAPVNTTYGATVILRKGTGAIERYVHVTAESRRTDMLERLTDELSLRPEQRAAIDSIMRHTDSVLRDVRLEMQPRVQQALDDSRRQIRSHLDSAQRVNFDTRQPARRWRIPR